VKREIEEYDIFYKFSKNLLLKSFKGGDLKSEFISKSSVPRAINSYTTFIKKYS